MVGGRCLRRSLKTLEYAHVSEFLHDPSKWPPWFVQACRAGAIDLGPGPDRITVRLRTTGENNRPLTIEFTAGQDDILVHHDGVVEVCDQTAFDEHYEVLP